MTDERQKRIDYLLSICVEEGDCLIWRGHVSEDKLPIVSEKRVKKSARRKLYEAIKGVELTRRQLVRTTCGDHLCMNPEHLKVMDVAKVRKEDAKRGSYSTPTMNAARVRTSRARGKLTIEQVREIRASTLTLVKLAAIYGVDKSVVGRIRRNEAWIDEASPFAGMFTQLVAANEPGRRRA